jgi:mannosylglycoprotein endo-beta-mannosidase
LAELESLESLEEFCMLTGDQYDRKGTIQFHLMQIYEGEEFFWKERSSENWLLQGDNNSAYFHKIANGRRRKNVMYSLKQNDILIGGT